LPAASVITPLAPSAIVALAMPSELPLVPKAHVELDVGPVAPKVSKVPLLPSMIVCVPVAVAPVSVVVKPVQSEMAP